MNQARITIPYAVANYAEMCELETYKAPVFLRPCRFGKSLAPQCPPP